MTTGRDGRVLPAIRAAGVAARAGEPAEVVHILMLRGIDEAQAAGFPADALADLERSARSLLPMFGMRVPKGHERTLWDRVLGKWPPLPDYRAIAETYLADAVDHPSRSARGSSHPRYR